MLIDHHADADAAHVEAIQEVLQLVVGSPVSPVALFHLHYALQRTKWEIKKGQKLLPRGGVFA